MCSLKPCAQHVIWLREANKQIDAEIFNNVFWSPDCPSILILTPPFFHTSIAPPLSWPQLISTRQSFNQQEWIITAATFFQLSLDACWAILRSSPTHSLQPIDPSHWSNDHTMGNWEVTQAHTCTHTHQMHSQLHMCTSIQTHNLLLYNKAIDYTKAMWPHLTSSSHWSTTRAHQQGETAGSLMLLCHLTAEFPSAATSCSVLRVLWLDRHPKREQAFTPVTLQAHAKANLLSNQLQVGCAGYKEITPVTDKTMDTPSINKSINQLRLLQLQ